MNQPTKHVIALSGGKDSTAMALRMAELHPEREFIRLITPTGDELPPMLDHWRMLGDVLGPLTVITSGQSLQAAIRSERMLPNWRARWCTRKLKLEPYFAWLVSNAPVASYVGLRADEGGRPGMEFPTLPGVEQRFPMREWGWGIGEVLAYLDDRDIVIPERTDCGACFFQTIEEWWRLWRDYPERYAEYVEIEAWVSAERGKPCTLRSDGRDSWPAGLAELAKRFELGGRPRGAGQEDLFKATRCRTCSL